MNILSFLYIIVKREKLYSKKVENRKGVGGFLKNSILCGRYRILESIGQGMSGIVYLAEHIKLKSLRVIKCVDKHHIMFEQFLKEAILLKNLNHPGIPIIFDLEEDENFLYIIEEYIEGKSLQAIVLHQTNLSFEKIIDYGIQICSIFEYLHHFEPFPILYLDLKPSHIIVCNTSIKIIDFGTAILMESDSPQEISFGTPYFSAPEQSGSLVLNQKTDIYAIGTILYYMSARKVPKIQKEKVSMMKHLAYYPDAFQQIIQTCLEEKAENRFGDVTELKNNLLTFQKYNSLTIAAIGSRQRVGVTHLSIAFSSYLNHHKIRCLYEEKNKAHVLESIKKYDRRTKEVDGFIKMKHFFGLPNYGSTIQVNKDNFEVIIQDYGSNHRHPQIQTADVILLVAGGNVWELEQSIQFLSDWKDERTILLASFINQKNIVRMFPLEKGEKLYKIPLFSDPFLSNGLSDRMFNELAKSVKITRERRSFFEKLKKSNQLTALTTVGILGSESGVGVTHLAILLGNYLTAKCNQHTAVVELSGKSSFRNIQRVYKSRHKPKNIGKCFELYDLAYFYEVSTADLSIIYNLGYDIIVLDFGFDYAKARVEYLKCQKKLVIGSVSDWKKLLFMQKIEMLLKETGGEMFQYLALFGEKVECQEWKKLYHIDIRGLPFEPDPYTIHNKNFDFYEKIIS